LHGCHGSNLEKKANTAEESQNERLFAFHPLRIAVLQMFDNRASSWSKGKFRLNHSHAGRECAPMDQFIGVHGRRGRDR
jgi:hypothetical protein